jgi:16S rRNA (uracil1498-N3)-methyltransferase
LEIDKSENRPDNHAMDVYRFYVPDLQKQAGGGAEVELPEDQAHHARGVLRMGAGEPVILFEGVGGWVEGVLERISKTKVIARVPGRINVEMPPGLRLTLFTAVPKGERAEQLIEQASQLNVEVVNWLSCDRGIVKPREGGQKMDKWRRLAVESAKQCRRTHVMEVIEPVTLDEALGSMPEESRVFWLDPGEGGQTMARASGNLRGGSVAALVGPEGGWSEREIGLLTRRVDAGRIMRVRLTETVLRIETACAAIAAILMSG